MASCLITTSGGTSGTLRIDYDLSSDHVTTYCSRGDVIYISDTATNITYTTLTGDVTASSGCVTITALPINYYLFTYDRLIKDTSSYNSRFDAVLLNSSVNAITETQDRYSKFGDLINAINTTLADDTIKITAIKTSAVGGTANYMNISFVMRVLGSELPSMRIKSNFDNISYLDGVTSTAVPAGFTELVIPIFSTPAP